MAGEFQELRAELTMDADGVERGVSQAERSLGGLKTAMGAAGAAASAMAAGGLAASVKAASDFQGAMVDLEKVTTPKTAREMGSAIKDMAGEMPLAQTELAGIAEQAGRLGVSGSDNISTFTRTTAEMATATDLNAQQAADSFARMSTLMNEPISNVRAIGDAVNALSNNMATSSSEITDAATRSSGALTNMGASSQEVLALNASMNTVSSSARIAGTRLRRMSQEMMSPGKASNLAEVLGMTSDEFKNMRSNAPVDLMRRMAREMKEGGETADGLREILSTTSRQGLASLGQNLDGLNTALETSNQQFAEGGSLAKEFETASQTFSNKLQILRNTLTNVAITIGNVLLPPLTRLVEWVTSGVQRFQEFNEATDGVAGAVGLITTAVGGALYALKTFLPVVTNGVTVTGALTTAFRTLLGPIGLVITAVGALGTAFATNFGGIRDQTVRVAQAIRNQFLRTTQTARDTIRPILSDLSAAWADHSDFVSSAVSMLASDIADRLIRGILTLGSAVNTQLNRIEAWWSAHGEAVTTTVNLLSARLQGMVITMMSAIQGIVNRDLDQTRFAFTRFTNKTVAAMELLGARLPAPIRSALGAVRQVVGSQLSRVQGVWETHRQQVLTTVRSGYQRVRSTISRIVSSIRSSVGQGLARVRGAFATNSQQIRGITGRATSWLQTNWDQAIAGLISIVVPGFRSIYNGVRDNMALIQTTIRTTIEGIRTYLSTVMTVIKNQIVTPLSNAESNTRQTFRSIRTEVRQSLAIVRDIVSSVMATVLTMWNKHLGEILATWEANISGPDGIVANARSAFNSLWNNIIKPTLDIIQAAWNRWGDDLVGIFRGVLNTVLTVAQIGMDAVLTAINVVLDLISGDWEGAWTSIKGFFQRTIRTIGSWLKTTGKSIVTTAIDIVIGAIKAPFEALYDWLIGNSKIPEMFGDVVSYIKTTAKQRISGAIDQVISSVKSAFSYMTGTGAGTLYGDVTGTLSDIKTEAENWVGDFTQPFMDAKNDVEGKFEDLKETLVGNSIVPDMLDDMVTEGEGWVGNFTSPFQDAKERVLSEFGKIKDGATDAASGIGETINEIAKKHGEFDDHAKKEVFSSLGNSDLKKLASSLTNLDYSHKKYESNPVRGNFGKAMSMLRETKRKGYTGTQFDNLLARGGNSGVYDLLERLHDFPQLDTGGKILEGGLYRGHAGERVLNPAETKRVDRGEHPDGGASGETYVTIDLGSLPEDAWVQADVLADMALAKFDERDERESRRL